MRTKVPRVVAVGAVAVLLASCATTEPTPTPTPTSTTTGAPTTACGPLTNIEWTNVERDERALTDVEILTADLVGDPTTGEAGSTREAPADGYPTETRATATTAGDATLASLLASLADRQVFIQTDSSTFRNSTAGIAVDHGGRWLAYAGGIEVTASYSATCSDDGRTVSGQLHGWTSPTSGELECSLQDQMPMTALGQQVRDYCARGA
jgi:hypothetical protein